MCTISEVTLLMDCVQVSVGRITLILQPNGTSPAADTAMVILASFQIAQNLDPDFNMPILFRPSHQHVVVKAKVCHTYLIFRAVTQLIHLQNIHFVFNAQHHCKSGNCKIHSWTQIQEREQTTRTIPYMEHADDDKFLVNMHAIHNASLIQETVKAIYGGPKPYFGTDRRSHHDAAAARLREIGPKKRAEANEKRKATREQNKATKQAQAAEEASALSRIQHSGEAAGSVDSSGSEEEESDSEWEMDEDAMEVD